MKRKYNYLLLLLGISLAFSACGKMKSGNGNESQVKNDNMPGYIQKNYQSMTAGFDSLKKDMPQGMQRLYHQIQHHYMVMQKESVPKQNGRMMRQWKGHEKPQT